MPRRCGDRSATRSPAWLVDPACHHPRLSFLRTQHPPDGTPQSRIGRKAPQLAKYYEQVELVPCAACLVDRVGRRLLCRALHQDQLADGT